METRTKFNLGDKVFGISYEHKLVEFAVGKINISIKEDGICTDYYPSDGKGSYVISPIEERYSFASKEDALNYINNK